MDATKIPTAWLPAAMAALVLGAAPSATAGVATVYKCFDRHLNVVYTDEPCRGEKLDIELGRVDQSAVAELAREREALSRAVAQRIADNRRYPVAAVSDYVVGPPPAEGSEIYYPAGWGYYPPYGNDRMRGRGNNFGGDHNRTRPARNVPAVPPNGLTNRTFR